MAFVSRVGNLLKQAGSKHANTGLSASNSSLYQSIRSMSSAKLFVGGLSYSTDENSLRQAFDQYGEVIEVKVVTDRETGRSRGFGFISFTSTEEANSALQDMDGKELHGRRVRVNFATEKPRTAYNNYGYGGGGYGSGGGSYGGGGGYGGGNYGGGGGGYGGGGNYGDGGSFGGGSSSNLGGYGGGDNSGNLNSPPSFDGLSSGPGGDTGALFGGGAAQSGGFQGSTDDGNEDLVDGKFGDDNEEPGGYANTRS